MSFFCRPLIVETKRSKNVLLGGQREGSSVACGSELPGKAVGKLRLPWRRFPAKFGGLDWSSVVSEWAFRLFRRCPRGEVS